MQLYLTLGTNLDTIILSHSRNQLIYNYISLQEPTYIQLYLTLGTKYIQLYLTLGTNLDTIISHSRNQLIYNYISLWEPTQIQLYLALGTNLDTIISHSRNHIYTIVSHSRNQIYPTLGTNLYIQIITWHFSYHTLGHDISPRADRLKG